MHLQCDVIQCNGKCVDDDLCSNTSTKRGQALSQRQFAGDGTLLAATTVFVLDPADAPCKFYLLIN